MEKLIEYIQGLGMASWGVCAATFLIGIIHWADNKDEVGVKSSLTVVPSDFFSFAVISSAAGLGLLCAFAEKSIVLDSVFDSTGDVIAKGDGATSSFLDDSDLFQMNLCLGILIKAIATTNVFYDLLFARNVFQTLTHSIFDISEGALFFLLMMVYEEHFLPMEAKSFSMLFFSNSSKGSSSSSSSSLSNSSVNASSTGTVAEKFEVVQSVENLLLHLVFCVFVSALLTLSPLIRYAIWSRSLARDQQNRAYELAQADEEEKKKNNAASTDDDDGGDKNQVEHKEIENSLKENQQEQEQAAAEETKIDEAQGQGSKARLPKKVNKKKNNNLKVEKENQLKMQMQEQQRNDLLIGSGLCATGLLLSVMILRRLNH